MIIEYENAEDFIQKIKEEEEQSTSGFFYRGQGN